MNYVFHEPQDYAFKDRDGHSGKIFDTHSPFTQHLIIECDDKLSVALTQREVEFSYYILDGDGFFVFDGERHKVSKNDLIVIPPGTTFNFGGKLRMLLMCTPHWSADQETVKKT